MFQDFNDLINESIEERLKTLNTCLPAKVLSYDSDKQYATVKPTIKIKLLKDGSPILVDRPQIFTVPVAHLRVMGFAIHLPVSEGDNVLLLFSPKLLME